jgi:hypothetical protein
MAVGACIFEGISTGDMHEALAVLADKEARGLSPNVVSRLKVDGAGSIRQWADGIHTAGARGRRCPFLPMAA